MSEGILSAIQTQPYFTFKLPISGIRIQFRQMLVKEEKVFMLTSDESEDDKINSIFQIIESCTKSDDKKYAVNKLCLADLESILIQIRMKSNGESCGVIRHCSSCKKDYDVKFDLKSSKIINDNKETTMNFGSFGVVLRNLKLTDSDNIDDELDELDTIIELMMKSIESIFTDDDVYSVEKHEKADLLGFINNLTSKQFKKISNFVINQPELVYDIKAKCIHCDKEDDFRLNGIMDFLD